MLLLVLFTMAAVGIVSYAIWPAIRDPVKDRGQPSKAAAADGAVRIHVSESLEGTLVAQLTAGEINRRQYLHAMECLAARDDARNPLAVPPETGSAA